MAAKIASKSFSQGRQRHRLTTPKMERQASHAPSTSASSSIGSTYTVDWRIYTSKLPYFFMRRRTFCRSLFSNWRLFAPFRTISPSFNRKISFIFVLLFIDFPDSPPGTESLRRCAGAECLRFRPDRPRCGQPSGCGHSFSPSAPWFQTRPSSARRIPR